MKMRKTKSKDWNPATFYIVIFLFIGSMSIQMIAMRRNFENFMRQSDVRIGLLREVVEKLQKGETVDVEKALGAGDQQKEHEWEDGMYPQTISISSSRYLTLGSSPPRDRK